MAIGTGLILGNSFLTCVSDKAMQQNKTPSQHFVERIARMSLASETLEEGEHLDGEALEGETQTLDWIITEARRVRDGLQGVK